MGRYLFIWFESNTNWLLLLFLITSFLVHGQNKNIIISDSLSSIVEKYNIDIWQKLKKTKFGEYHIIKARDKWITSVSHTTRRSYEEDISRQKFSFTLVNEKSDFAKVKAIDTEISKYNQTSGLGGFLFQAATGIESTKYEGLGNSLKLSATISINGDETDPWKLHLEETIISDGETTVIGTITNGKRIIDIVQVYFDKDGTYYGDWSYPPKRFEFIKNEQSIGVIRIKYTKPDFWFEYDTQFWFRPNLEPTIKLVLAASMTTIAKSYFGQRMEPTFN